MFTLLVKWLDGHFYFNEHNTFWNEHYINELNKYICIILDKAKGQTHLIIHHNEKNQRIYLWCAAKDNWASQIRKWL